MNKNTQFTIPPLQVLLKCLGLDLIFFAGLLVYYQTIMYFNLIEAIQNIPLSHLGLVIRVLFLSPVYLLFPVGWYTFVKSLKISLLATKHIVFLDNIGTLYLINLRLALASFLTFGVFEWLGESVTEQAMPILAGLYLALTFSILGIGACISHHHWNQRHLNPTLMAFSSTLQWKTSMPYFLASIISIAVLNISAYMFYSQLSTSQYFTSPFPAWASLSFLMLEMLAIMIFLNAYQWRLYHY